MDQSDFSLAAQRLAPKLLEALRGEDYMTISMALAGTFAYFTVAMGESKTNAGHTFMRMFYAAIEGLKNEQHKQTRN